MREEFVKRGTMKRYSSRNRGRKKLPLVILLLLLAACLAGTLGALAKEKKISDEAREKAAEAAKQLVTPSPTPENEVTGKPANTQQVADGAYGMWAPPTPTPILYDPDGTPIWMADWKDERTPVEAHGIYVSSEFTVNRQHDEDRIKAFDKLLELAKRTEINTMIIDVKYESGAILHEFNNELINKYGTTVECLSFIPEYIKKLHENGIYVVARLVCFKDTKLAAVRPDLAIYNNNGSLYRDNNWSNWVSPYKKETWEYIAEVGKECAKIGFDEINLDYVRFPTDNVSNVNWGPEAATTTKTQAITSGVKYLCEQFRACNLFVSADVYGIVMSSPKDAANVGQNFMEMAQYFDYLCPMVYPSHYDKSWVSTGDWPDLHPYEVITKSLAYSVTEIAKIPENHHRAKVRAWLQDFTADYLGKGRYMEYDAEAVLAEIKAVNDTGYTEWLLWNANGTYTEGALKKAD